MVLERILVADDDADARSFLADLVRHDGFEVSEAQDGNQAAVLLEQGRYDVVLTDLVMPGQSGFEVMRLARERNPEVICIALTSFGSLDSAIDSLRHGAYSYLLKPCDPGVFRHTMRLGLERQRLAKELRLRNQELEQANRELDARVQQATSELQALNRRVLTEMASLQEVDRLKSAFLANVSHDLKNPMTTVMGYAKCLLEDEAIAQLPEAKGCLQTLCKAATHMQYLVSQLVEAARLTSGKIALSLSPVNPGEAIQEAAALVRIQAEDKGVVFEVRWEGGAAVAVQADRGRLLQILSNLLGNAIKFTPVGGKVLLRAWSEEGAIHFCVEDTGPGIKSEHQARIFERFYQGEASASGSSLRGLGLGLCIAKDLVGLHNGRIWVESDPGQGSKFRFTLPVRKE